jgi:threonine dehydrogenase-like Zn-dependent dehydrogenase
MRAVVCHSPRDLALEERPEAIRGADEALIAVRRIGICGTDYHIYEGSHPYLEYPRILGHALSGEVFEVPRGSVLTPGQRLLVNPTCPAESASCRKGKPNRCVRIAVLGVHRDGGMCERISVPERNLYPAGSLTFDEAASVEFLSIGAHAVARPGACGRAGPIGLGVALFAGLAGGDVTVIDPRRLFATFSVEVRRRPRLVTNPSQELNRRRPGPGLQHLKASLIVWPPRGGRYAKSALR